jgi:ATP adenylyltransferase
MEFIAAPKPTGCIFCEFPAAPEADDRANLLVHRSAHAFTCLNKYPYTSGHLMVIPRAHVSELSALAPDAWADLQAELRRAVAVLQAVYRPEGMNVGMNLGKAAGAGIEAHLHWHVVPRWVGDNNFMPVIADQRVVPEALEAAWERLRAGFQAGAP